MRLRWIWLTVAISPLAGCPGEEDSASLFGEPTTGATGTTGGPPSITTVASTIDPGMTGPPPSDGSGTTVADDDTSGETTVGVSASTSDGSGGPGSTGQATSTGSDGSSSGGESSSGGDPSTTSGITTSGGSSSTGATSMGSASSSSTDGGSSGGCVPSGVGTYGDCLAEDGTINNAVCANGAATCIVNDTMNPFIGACAVQNCSDACECPPHPGTGTAPVTCEDLTGDLVGECWLDCSDGDTCPTGMQCWADTLCLWPNMDDGSTPYDDCVNNPNSVCGLDGICIVDNVTDPTLGVCSDPCTLVADCPPAPPTGNAPVTCTDLVGGNGTSECILNCAGGLTCPDGMTCEANIFCVWDGV